MIKQTNEQTIPYDCICKSYLEPTNSTFDVLPIYDINSRQRTTNALPYFATISNDSIYYRPGGTRTNAGSAFEIEMYKGPGQFRFHSVKIAPYSTPKQQMVGGIVLNTGINIQAGSGETRFTKSGINSEIKIDDASQVNKVVLSASGNSYLNGGNVGIGDTTPEATLTVKKGSEGAYFSAGGDTANNRQLVFTSSNGNGSNGAKHQINATSSNGIIALATANVDRLTVGNTGNVGIGTTSPGYKLSVAGGISAGGKLTYTKSTGSLDTTGYDVAGLTTSTNGQSAGFTFTCFGHSGGYQKIVYSCYNSGGNWYASKVIDEGTNQLDVVASANSTTITFTFKSISGTMSYTPRVTVEAVGTAINSTYA